MIQARTLEKYKAQSPEIAKETGTKPEDVKKVMEAIEKRIIKNHRQPREPAPEGGIGVRAAARKYNIDDSLISYWLKTNKIKLIKKTRNWTYIDENSLIEYINNRNNKNFEK